MKYFGLYYHNIPLSDDKLYKYNYNDENLLETINSSLYDTKKFIIPVIDSITNLEDYIKHQKTMRDISIFGNGEFFYNDSLALIAANNHESFLDLFEVWDEYLKQMFNENKMGGDYAEIRKLYYEGITAIPTSRDKVYNDPELYKKAIAEIVYADKIATAARSNCHTLPLSATGTALKSTTNLYAARIFSLDSAFAPKIQSRS